MAGLTRPRGRPAYWSASAISAAQIGALALVPPLLRIVVLPPSLRTMAMPVWPLASADTSGTPRVALMAGTPSWYSGRGNRRLNPPPDAWTGDPGLPYGRPQAVSPCQSPVVWLAVRLVPPAPSTSGSEASRLTSLTGVNVPVPVSARRHRTVRPPLR